MAGRNLSCYDDMKRIGRYSVFLFENVTNQSFVKTLFEGREMFWNVKPLDGTTAIDGANTFLVIGQDGVVGLLYRVKSERDLFRVVPFAHPLEPSSISKIKKTKREIKRTLKRHEHEAKR
jgi:hypothetical protein